MSINKEIKQYEIIIPIIVNSISYFLLPKSFYLIFCIINLIYLISIYFGNSNVFNVKCSVFDYIGSITILLFIVITSFEIKIILIPVLELLIVRIVRYNFNNITNENKQSYKNNKLNEQINVESKKTINNKDKNIKEQSNELINSIASKEIEVKLTKDHKVEEDMEFLKLQMQQVVIALSNNNEIKEQLVQFNNVKKEIYAINEKLNKLDENIKSKNIGEKLVKDVIELKKKINDNKIIKDIIEECHIKKLDFSNSKHLKNYEIREKFIEALKISTNEVNIISPWISGWIFEKDFISLLEEALKRGTKIKIIYGIGDINDERNRSSKNNAEKLKRILNRYNENFKIIRGNTHYKLLLCDNKFYIQGSYNFLSFKGTYNNGDVRDEGAIYSENESIIKDFRVEYFNF